MSHRPSHADHSLRVRWSALFATLATIALVAMGLTWTSGQADAYSKMNVIYHEQLNGHITITGNSLADCGSDYYCSRAHAGTYDASNNHFPMSNLDQDNDPLTRNSSMAHIDIPDGATVAKAYLFWSATSYATKDQGTIKFKTPNGKYQTIQGKRFSHHPDMSYGAWTNYDDVTEIVKAGGSGDYWGADVKMDYGYDHYAGWALVVVIEDPNDDPRDLAVFEGLALLRADGVNDNAELTVDGFQAPKTGPVTAKFGSVTWEGDRSIPGDYFKVNDKLLGDAGSPTNNYFVSTVTDGGKLKTDRNPNDRINFSVDAKTADASKFVKNGDTSAKLELGTTGDTYYVSAVTTQIDIYVPKIVTTKTANNLTAAERGDDVARVGDVVEYSMVLLNKGKDTAKNVVLTDKLPDGVEYIPGSLKLVNEDGTTPLTDQAGDDSGSAVDGNVKINLGSEASSDKGGNMPFQDTQTVKLRVRITEAGIDTDITNKADVTYEANTGSKKYSSPSSPVSTKVEPDADMAITKTGPKQVAPGEEIEWTITATNNGPSDAQDVKVVDTLPAGITDAQIVAPATGCELADGKVTCQFGTMSKDATQTITLKAKVPADSTATELSNSAIVQSSTADRNADNDRATTATAVVPKADLKIEKSVDKATPVPGEELTWTLTVTNDGPSVSREITVSDTLPDGLVITGDPTPSVKAQCSHTEQRAACDVASLEPGQTMTMTVPTRLSETWTSTDGLTNQAAVQSQVTPDPDTENNQATVTVTPQEPQADVEVTKELLSESFVPGKTATYRLKVTNKGPSTATNVKVEDALPTGLTLESVAASVECDSTDNSFACTYPSISNGGVREVTVTVNIAADVTEDVTNTASASSDTSDPNSENDSSSATGTPSPSADLKLVKTAPEEVVNAGEEVTFTLVLSNAGPSVAKAATVVDTLPQDLTFVSASAEDPNLSCTPTGEGNKTINCGPIDVKPGEEKKITVTAEIPSSATIDPDNPITNTAEASSTTPDPDTANNKANAQVPTDTSADLSVVKTGDSEPVVKGEKATWKLVVTNRGPSDAKNVEVTDTLPADIVADTISVDSVEGTALQCSVSGAKLTCTSVSYPDDATSTITVSGTVKADSTATSLENTASVTSTTADPSDSNNSSTSSTDLTAKADVKVVKEGPQTAIAGEDLTYTLKVTNDGPSQVPSARVVDSLPAGTTLVSVSLADQVDGESCSGEPGSQEARCEVLNLAKGQTRIVTVVAHLLPGTAADSELTNTGIVASDIDDPDESNNTSTTPTKVETKAKIDIDKKANAKKFVAGTHSSYNITVTNHGPSTARNVVVTDELPESLVGTSVQSSGQCEITGQTVTCTFDSVPPVKERPITIAVGVDVKPDAPAQITNGASLSSDTPNPDGVTESSAKTPVERQADLSIEKTTESKTVPAGKGLQWNLTVTNAGPSQAENVKITDTLPEGVEPASVPEGCTYDETSRQVTCELGALEAGANRVVELVVSVDENQLPGEITNHASVSSDTADPNKDNDEADSSVEVTNKSTVRIEKDPALKTAIAGQEAEWLITVYNDGPSTAHGTQVTDTLPAGLTPTSANIGKGKTQRECTITGQDVKCEVGDLKPGVETITVTVLVDSNYQESEAENTASLQTESPSNASAASPLFADAKVKIGREADLSVTKTVKVYNDKGELVDGTPVAGERFAYVITGTNAGTSSSRDSIISDVLPAGLTINKVQVDAGTCTHDAEYEVGDEETSGLLECKHGGYLEVGQKWTVTVDATLTSDTDGTEIANTATISGGQPDPEPENNTSTASFTPNTRADVSVSKSLVGSMVPGERAKWLMTVSNAGPSVARSVELVDALPASVSDVQVESVSDFGAECTVSGQQVTCQLGDLDATDSVDVIVTGLVDSSVVDSVENTASVSSDTPDPDEKNNSSAVTSTPQPSAELEVTKTASPSPVIPGNAVTWQLQVTNKGPSQALGVEVKDALPQGTTVTSAKLGGKACTTKDNNVTCAVGTLAVNASAMITVKADVAAGITGDKLENTASATTTTSPGKTWTGKSSVDLERHSDLRIEKTASAESVVAGGVITYTLTAVNGGSSDSASASITDVIPQGLTDVSASSEVGSCRVADGQVVCERDQALVVDGSWVVTVTGKVDPAFSGDSIANTASVSGPNRDDDDSNNSSTATTSVTTSADLAIEKAITGDLVPGKRGEWTITVTNQGPSVARDVVMTDVLAEYASDITATSPELSCEVDGQVVECKGESLDVDATATVTISALLAEDITGDLENIAAVKSSTPDPQEDNDMASATGPALPDTTISVVKTAGAEKIQQGEGVTWTIVVTNDGPSTATDLRVADQMDRRLTMDTIEIDNGTCETQAHEFDCTIETLGAGKSETLTYSTKTDVNAKVGDAVNTVTVATPSDGDGEPSIITDDAQVTITALPAPSEPEETLPVTGAQVAGLFTLALMFLATGGGLVYASRRRQEA